MSEEMTAAAIVKRANGWISRLTQLEQTETVSRLLKRAEDLAEKARLAEIHELDELLAQLRKVAESLDSQIEGELT